jgi:hypothetical protein
MSSFEEICLEFEVLSKSKVTNIGDLDGLYPLHHSGEVSGTSSPGFSTWLHRSIQKSNCQSKDSVWCRMDRCLHAKNSAMKHISKNLCFLGQNVVGWDGGASKHPARRSAHAFRNQTNQHRSRLLSNPSQIRRPTNIF